MLCPNCGYNNQPNNRFCVRCGIDIAAPPAPETPSFDVAAATPPAPGASPPPPAPSDPAADPAASAPPNPWGTPPPASASGGTAGSYPPPDPTGPNPGSVLPPNAQTPGAPAANPFAPPPPIGAPGSYPPPAAYGQYPVYPPPGLAPGSTNGLATAALVLGAVGWIPCGIGSLVAIVLGFIARTQIRESRGRQGGDGLALAGIILGFIGVGIWLLLLILGATMGSSNTS
ncbi:MAG: hypothetical protein QOF59_2135 [Actinomycetota bacterium]|jgi:hypothetical protein|nr:hypothetical protein [Actinomycetota bacterium]